MNIEVYIENGCMYCEYVTDWLEYNNIKYNKNIIQYHNKKKILSFLTEKSKHRIKTLPQVFINNQYIGGHTEFLLKHNIILENHKKELDGDKNILKNGLYLL